MRDTIYGDRVSLTKDEILSYGAEINNLDQVLEVLSKLEFSLDYVGFANQQHKYTLTIYSNKYGAKQEFEYSEGSMCEELTEENEKEKIFNALYCLVSDFGATFSCEDEIDFIEEFDYKDNLREGQRIWKEIQKNNKKLFTLLAENELCILGENIVL